MMKKQSVWILVIGVILIILLIWKFSGKSEKKAQNPMQGGKPQSKVEAYVVQPKLLVDEISVSGSLAANDEVELKNEVAGRIVKLYLPEGKAVKEGTLLVKLYDDDLQANLKKLEAQLAIHEQILNRQSELLKVSGISQNEYDQTSLQVNSIKADIDIQKALIRKTEILAPFDGVIGLRNVSIGAEVTPSTSLATIRSSDKLKLDFSVPEKYTSSIKSGMKIKFTLYNKNAEYDATVFATEQGIDADTRNLRVRAMVDSRSDELISGAFTNVNLRLSEKNDALMIPTQAIIPSEETKRVIVAKNGTAHFTEVKTGVRKPSEVEITEGLRPGDTVVTSGVLFLKEGAKLSYSSVKSSTL
jgi:membrane fusion protein, multidrug efflux system